MKLSKKMRKTVRKNKRSKTARKRVKSVHHRRTMRGGEITIRSEFGKPREQTLLAFEIAKRQFDEANIRLVRTDTGLSTPRINLLSDLYKLVYDNIRTNKDTEGTEEYRVKTAYLASRKITNKFSDLRLAWAMFLYVATKEYLQTKTTLHTFGRWLGFAGSRFDAFFDDLFIKTNPLGLTDGIFDANPSVDVASYMEEWNNMNFMDFLDETTKYCVDLIDRLINKQVVEHARIGDNPTKTEMIAMMGRVKDMVKIDYRSSNGSAFNRMASEPPSENEHINTALRLAKKQNEDYERWKHEQRQLHP